MDHVLVSGSLFERIAVTAAEMHEANPTLALETCIENAILEDLIVYGNSDGDSKSRSILVFQHGKDDWEMGGKKGN